MLPVFPPLFDWHHARCLQLRIKLRDFDTPRDKKSAIKTIAKKSEGRGIGSQLVCAPGLEQVGYVAVPPCWQVQPESSAAR